MSEFMPRNDFVAMEKTLKEDTAAAAPLPPFNADRKKKKKSGAFGIFRAALHILRKKSDEKKKQSPIESDNGDWKKIVGSMRPLHVQETPQSPMYQMSPFSDDLMVPSSPTASSSCGTMSQYASALNLRDLDNTEEEEGDPDEVFDAITGDEEIDAKADEFIAQFYKQIQQQNSSRYQERGM